MLKGQKKRKLLREKLDEKLGVKAASKDGRKQRGAAQPSEVSTHTGRLSKSRPRDPALHIASKGEECESDLSWHGQSTTRTATARKPEGAALESDSASSSSTDLPSRAGSLLRQDTLLGRGRRPGGPSTPSTILRTIPCYPHVDNSCWLDVALQVLFVSTTLDFRSFEERFRDVIPHDRLLYKLYRCMNLRMLVQSEPTGQNNNPQYLGLQRDVFRKHLFEHDKPLVNSMNSQENVFVSCYSSEIICDRST